MIRRRITATLTILFITLSISAACRPDRGREPIVTKEIVTDKDLEPMLELKRVGFVNDYANLLDDDERNRLETRLSTLQKGSDVEFVVVIVDSLNGQTLEGYSSKLIRSWNLDPHNEGDKKYFFLLR